MLYSKMPTKKSTWTIYGVSQDKKIFVKMYAAQNQITVGEALEKIIDTFMGDKNTDKSQ